jgi:3-phenylpropionate/trans-cinnamate dioxygenase ferredoxin reductase subunit
MSAMVIVGGGHAAGQNAASLRQEGYDGEIIIIGDDTHIPYQRPPLSKQYLSGEHGLERVYLRPEKFYEERNIELRLGVTVTKINPDEHTVITSTGDTVSYEKLLLATGSRPRILNAPGSDLPGIHYLRAVDDVYNIQAEIPQVNNVCIVGGGYIGLEVASVIVSAGHNVTVLEMEDRILQRVTTPKMSAFYEELHSSHSVNIVTNTSVSGFTGDARVEKVLCGDLSIPADLIIVGIGIIPNIELAETAGLACDNGIIVDEYCRTSNPDIFAAGDNTNHPNPILNRRLRLESVPNAMEQARVAAANMIGGDKTYETIPWFWSDQYGLKLQMMGFSADGETEVIRGDKATNQFAVFYLHENTVVAVDAVNSPREFMVCKQLYGKSVDPVKLADLGVDLKTLI